MTFPPERHLRPTTRRYLCWLGWIMYRIPAQSIEESGFSPSKELHPVTLLDGAGGSLFKLVEKNGPSRRERALGVEGLGRREFGNPVRNVLIAQA